MARTPLTIVIPAYNEERRLEQTLRSAIDYFRAADRAFGITVVDDGSRDGTSMLVKRLADELGSITLIRLPANRGKGYAVRTGMVNASTELVLFADADGATPWPEIERLDAAVSGGADVAIGSRVVVGQGVKVEARPLRRFIGRSFHWLVSTLTVPGFQDTQCGFKLFRGAVAQDLFSRMRMNGFSFDVEVLLMAQRGTYRVDEVPVSWTHQAGSKVNLVTDSLRMLFDLFRIRSAALRGEYDKPHVATLPIAPSPTQG